MPPTRLLFVCTGNICRSPTAEAVLRHHTRGAEGGDSILIDSAGTHGYHVGEPPDQRAIDIAAMSGVDMAGLRARRIEGSDFNTFDALIAMDSTHHHYLEGVAKGRPEYVSKIIRFTAFLGDPEGNVPDPYYGSIRDFETVYTLIDQGCRAMMAHWAAYKRWQ